METIYLRKLKKATSITVVFMLLFSILSPFRNVAFAIGADFYTTEINPNVEYSTGTYASKIDAIIIASTPEEGNTVTIGGITYTFKGVGYSDPVVENEVYVGSTPDEATSNLINAINGTTCTPAGAPATWNEVCSGIVPDENVFASQGSASNMITLDAKNIGAVGNVIVSSNNVFISVNSPLVGGLDEVLAEQQETTYTPTSLIYPNTIYRAVLNGVNYNYLTATGSTVEDIVDGLQPDMDLDSEVTCTEDNSKITCIADTAGVSFSTGSMIVDLNPLTDAINAEFSDGASRNIYNLDSLFYTSTSWDAYVQAIEDAIALESNRDATDSDITNAIDAISTAKSSLELDIFTNSYDISTSTGSNLDADSYNGKTYVTYEKNGNIYFKEGVGSEELVGSGTNPAIAVGSGGIVHIAYENGGSIIYAKKISSWNTESVGTGNSADIDTDDSNFAHIVYKGDYYLDGYIDVIYTKNISGVFVPSVIANGYYSGWDGWSSTSDYYESIPVIKIDSNSKYHILYNHHNIYRTNSGSDHSYDLQYVTNASGGSVNKGGNYFIYKNSLTIDSNNKAHVLYGTKYYGYVNGGVWTETDLGIVSGNLSISSDGTSIGIAYANGVDEIRYMQDDGNGFIGSTLIGTTSSYYPTVTRNNGQTYVYYVKDGEVKLASTTAVYSVPGHIDNVDNSFVSSLSGAITLSNLQVGGVYSLMSGTTLVSSGVLVATSSTGSLKLNPFYFQNYGKYTLTLKGTYNSTTTDSIDTVDLYVGPMDFQDLYVNQISPILTSNGIVNNFTGVTYDNVQDFTGLYFEKTGLGKIVFGSGMDLTNSGTIAFIQNLPTYLSMDDGHISFDPSNSDFSHYGAQLYMYFDSGSTFVSSITDPNAFVVTSSTGLILDASTVLSNIHGACNAMPPYDCTLFFDTSHFTTFDLKPTLTSVSMSSNNTYSGALAKNGDRIVLDFVGSEALPSRSVVIAGTGASSVVDLGGNHYRATSVPLNTVSTGATFGIDFMDANGNNGDHVYATTDGSSLVIDNQAPTASVIYSNTGATAGNVIATLTGASEPITITNNAGFDIYIFSNNGSFTFNFRDSVGNTGSVIANVTNINKNVPIITLNGSGTINLEKGTNYTELGALWTDQTDGTGAVSIMSGSVDKDILGTYYVQYSYVNSLGLTGSTTRTVNVVDTIAPIISETTPILSLIDDNTPSVVISASELSTPSFSGSCKSGTGTNTILAGNNTITFNPLSDGLHNDCYITLTDVSGNHSNPLHVSNFTVDTTDPLVVYKQIKNIKDESVDLDIKFTEPNIDSSTGSVLFYQSGFLIGRYDLDFSGSVAFTSMIGLSPDTEYTYSFYLSDILGHTKTETGAFKTAKVITLGLENTETGAISLGFTGGLNEGGEFNLTGNLVISSDINDDDYLTGSLTLSGVNIIVSSGSWDGFLLPPTLIDTGSEESATGSEIGNGVVIVQTIKTGAEGTSLSSTGGYFEVSFMIPGYSAGKTFILYRSSDGNTWEQNYPDKTCTLDSNLMCTFRTDHLSFFAPGLDTEPDSFSFTSLTGKELNTLYYSSITVAGIDTASPISISGGEYSIGSGAYTSVSSTVNNGQSVTVKLMSSSSNNDTKTATLTIGGVSASFNVTTKSAPSSGGGGGGGSSIIKDSCSNGDFSSSYYDGTCGTKSVESTGTGKTNSNDNNVSDGEISITLEDITSQDMDIFSDIKESFAKGYIKELYNKGIVKGYEDKTFKPDNNITRAEFLSIVMKSLDIDLTSTGTNDFVDIPSDGEWMIKYVIKAKELGIISGQMIDSKLKFRPNDFITRAEAVSILLKTSNIDLTSIGTNDFVDIPSDGEWMIKYVIKAKELGIISGQMIDSKLKFRPNDFITRAEVSKIVVKFLGIN